MSSLLFTVGSGSGGNGIDTGINAVFGTVTDGGLLPIGTATHYAITTSGGNTILSLDDPTLDQTDIGQVVVQDTQYQPADATFAVIGDVATWIWPWGSLGALTPGATNVDASVTIPDCSCGAPLTVTVLSANGDPAPLTGDWTGSLTGYCNAAAQSGAQGSIDIQRLGGRYGIVAAGQAIVDGTKYFLLAMEDGTPRDFCTCVTVTLVSEGTHTAYNMLNVQYFATGADVLGLGIGDSFPGPFFVWQSDVNNFSGGIDTTVSFCGVAMDDFNCACEAVSPWDTLVNVRKKMLVRLGYPNQATNPPPGMALLVDQFLRDAQDEIYLQLQRAALRTQRFFKWTMVPGQRYYAFTDEEESCNLLNPYKVTWVGFEDLNQAWYRLDEGIPPEYYTRANINFGWPTRFELRSCIEIFPAPQAAYTLWIKGDFGLAPLVEDTDRFTISDIAVYLLALGNAKAHYGQKDAQLVLTQAGNYSKSLVAGTHGTRRYVPRSDTENPLTPPKFLPLGNEAP